MVTQELTGCVVEIQVSCNNIIPAMCRPSHCQSLAAMVKPSTDHVTAGWFVVLVHSSYCCGSVRRLSCAHFALRARCLDATAAQLASGPPGGVSDRSSRFGWRARGDGGSMGGHRRSTPRRHRRRLESPLPDPAGSLCLLDCPASIDGIRLRNCGPSRRHSLDRAPDSADSSLSLQLLFSS
jgi:hypothetical protein